MLIITIQICIQTNFLSYKTIQITYFIILKEFHCPQAIKTNTKSKILSPSLLKYADQYQFSTRKYLDTILVQLTSDHSALSLSLSPESSTLFILVRILCFLLFLFSIIFWFQSLCTFLSF